MNARQHLAESSSLNVQRLNGGWVILVPTAEVPLACRVPADVLRYVAIYLGAPSLKLNWECGEHECQPGTGLLASKIDGGFLLSIPRGSPAPGFVNATMKQIRFTPRDVILDVGHWLGLQEAPPEPEDPIWMEHLTLYSDDGLYIVSFAEESPLTADDRARIAQALANSLGDLTLTQVDALVFHLSRSRHSQERPLRTTDLLCSLISTFPLLPFMTGLTAQPSRCGWELPPLVNSKALRLND